jgi:hypothetical protein
VKEIPLIFSADSVNAILAGTKTQTRRVMNPQPHTGLRQSPFVPSGVEDGHGREMKLRFAPGDLIWVRETWGAVWPIDKEDVDLEECKIEYRADLPVGCTDYPGQWPKEDAQGSDEAPKWKSPMFMPRWASRITLEVTEVRIQVLRQISEQDAMAEGVTIPEHKQGTVRLPHGGAPVLKTSFASEFATAWDKINGKKHPYDSDPFVWCLTFERIA